jgi:hypothetical protein
MQFGLNSNSPRTRGRNDNQKDMGILPIPFISPEYSRDINLGYGMLDLKRNRPEIN